MRNVTLDYLKLGMVCMVIAIHTHLFSDVSPLIGHLLEDGLFRIAVPVFFVINGYFFFSVLQKNPYPVSWFIKLTTLYVFWTLAYAIIWTQSEDFARAPIITTIKVFILGYGHLWYVIALICAAFSLNILHHLKANNKVLLTLVVALFIVGWLIQQGTDQGILGAPFNKKADRNFLFFGFPFVAIGYLLARTGAAQIIPKKSVKTVFALSLCCLLVESIMHADQNSKDILLALIVLAPAIFLMTMQCKQMESSRNISKLATNMYFFHGFVVEGLKNVIALNSIELTLYSIIFSALGAYMIGASTYFLSNSRSGINT